MGRPATVEDIARVVLFLVSAEAQHIAGQTLNVDGRWTAVGPTPD
jgi:NAD(P)-dependent dehydrogenase (short-subunit alcohol dehydrogenase family)